MQRRHQILFRKIGTKLFQLFESECWQKRKKTPKYEKKNVFIIAKMAALGWGRDNFYIAKYHDFECFWTQIWLARVQQ